MAFHTAMPVAAWDALADAPLGSGDGRIHVIPSIAPYSAWNGKRLDVTDTDGRA